MNNEELNFVDEYEKLCKKYEMYIHWREGLRKPETIQEMDYHIGKLKGDNDENSKRFRKVNV